MMALIGDEMCGCIVEIWQGWCGVRLRCSCFFFWWEMVVGGAWWFGRGSEWVEFDLVCESAGGDLLAFFVFGEGFVYMRDVCFVIGRGVKEWRIRLDDIE